MVAVVVRPFSRADVTDVLAMMRDLAQFEGYLDRFSITEDDVVEHGLGLSPRFGIFVA